MTVLETAWHTARKSHVCGVCCGTIGAGDRYLRQRSIYDGEPQTFKAHSLCEAAYWKAYSDLGLYDNESPDWTEDIRPLVFGALAILDGWTPEHS